MITDGNTTEPERLPTKEEFDRLARRLSERIVQACLPALIEAAIADLAESDRLPPSVRQLLLYRKYASGQREPEPEPERPVTRRPRRSARN